MSEFVLQPCHLRGTQLTPLKSQTALTLDWNALKAKFAPSNDTQALRSLHAARVGAFIGLARDRKNPTISRNFMVLNEDRSARMDWILNKDPTFANRLLEVYKIVQVKWDSAFLENS
jgi:hypothetical protein